MTLPVDSTQEQGSVSAEIRFTAQGDRRTLEAFYLELRELARQQGLKITYRLSPTKPQDQAES